MNATNARNQAIGFTKKYVADSLSGVGALKGAPCEVVDQKDDDELERTVVTLSWEDSSGNTQTQEVYIPYGKQGEQGENGLSIQSVEINDDNELVFELEDGTQLPGVAFPSTGGASISEEIGNTIEMKDDGLFVPAYNSEYTKPDSELSEMNLYDLFDYIEYNYTGKNAKVCLPLNDEDYNLSCALLESSVVSSSDYTGTENITHFILRCMKTNPDDDRDSSYDVIVFETFRGSTFDDCPWRNTSNNCLDTLPQVVYLPTNNNTCVTFDNGSYSDISASIYYFILNNILTIHIDVNKCTSSCKMELNLPKIISYATESVDLVSPIFGKGLSSDYSIVGELEIAAGNTFYINVDECSNAQGYITMPLKFEKTQ
jgi:hypothetical protein